MATVTTSHPEPPRRITDSWHDDARRVARGIRRRVLEHVIRNRGGYLSQACSTAEILATLYVRVLKLAPAEALLPGPFPGVPGKNVRGPSPGTAFHGPRARTLTALSFRLRNMR